MFGYCLSVRREPLDTLLLQRTARSSSIDVGERISATDLLWEGERVVGVRLLTPDGSREVHARIIIGADGRHSFVARADPEPLFGGASLMHELFK